MTKKIDPSISTAVDGIFTDALTSINSKLAYLRSQKAGLLQQRDSITGQISVLDVQIEQCNQQLHAVTILQSSKAGTLYP